LSFDDNGQITFVKLGGDRAIREGIRLHSEDQKRIEAIHKARSDTDVNELALAKYMVNIFKISYDDGQPY
jgi:hypothetical protein